MPKTVFIAHPISGDVENNIERVIAICKCIHSAEIIPIFPSLTWRRYLSHGSETQALADAVNFEYFRRGMVDEVWFYGTRMSDGMRREALLAHQFGIKLVGKSAATRAALTEMGLNYDVARPHVGSQLAADIGESRCGLAYWETH